MHIVGVDVGGTNTDAVLLRIESDQKPQVIATAKATTSADVVSGLLRAVQQVIGNNEVAAVMVGTTHFINALIQRQGLAKVCTIRLCGPATHSLPPMVNWPRDLKDAIDGLTVLVSGGYFFDGSPISPLNEDEIRDVVRRALALGIHTFCVCGVFSPCRKDQEERVGAIIREASSTAYITLSHDIAGVGLCERENASILNACLRPLAARTIGTLEDALPPGVPFFLTKNAGTLLSSDESMRWPVFTFASGPTNSMIGAAYLTGIKNGIVVDVGGTSIDIGVIADGRPRQTHANVRLVDEIRVNITVPDTVSLPMGGGSVVRVNDQDGSVQVGPDSVARRLEQEALAFGGFTLTCTDIALAAGLASGIGHCSVQISPSVVDQVLTYIRQLLARSIDRVKTSLEAVPVVLCGGGSILIDIDQSYSGVTQLVRPDHFAVCNAVGAALCSVSATVDSIVDLLPSSVDGGVQRKRELDRLTMSVRQLCEQNGARPSTINLVELEEIPLAYQSGGSKHRVQLTAIGQLDLGRFNSGTQTKRVRHVTTETAREAPRDIKPPVQVDYRKSQPVFDSHGVWCVDAIDIEYIAYGTGILGCGGGGESYHCKLWCLKVIRENKQTMRVVPASFFRSSSELLAEVAFMGAPTVSHELLSNGRECLDATDAMERYVSKKIVGVFSGEIGGSNGLMGLLVAAHKGVPCVDCDGLGRAFPCLNHALAFINGMPVTPCCLCDVRGETVMCTSAMASTPKELEDIFREECTKRGLIVGLCLPPMAGHELEKNTLANSLSRAWFLGHAKFNHPCDAIEAVARAGHGRILLSDGKVTSVERQTAGGFVRGRVTIEVNGRLVLIDFQNENLVVRDESGEVLATVPDLITLVEQDSAEPLATETIKYGYRVSVLILPAPQPLTTPHVLQHLGPKAFGYDFPDFEYKPFHAPIPSVWDVFLTEKQR